MFGSGCAQEQTESQRVFQIIYDMMPNLKVCLWFRKHLVGDALDIIIDIHKQLDKMEKALLKENSDLAKKVAESKQTQ